MQSSRKVLVFALALGILAVVGTAGLANASGFGFGFGGNSENRSSLIQKLVDRFNLNKGEVEAVFDEHKDEMQEQRRNQAGERLNQAVEDGKITEDQKNALLEKIQQWREQWSEQRDLSAEEKREKMQEHREEMRQWMEDSNIDFGFLGMGFGRGFHRGLGK